MVLISFVAFYDLSIHFMLEYYTNLPKNKNIKDVYEGSWSLAKKKLQIEVVYSYSAFKWCMYF